ncbi:hypothetical protein CALCODRAFT_90090 [Calocera cornea HHB12733]|uniref:Uncharacterized protein n=1 Tax=Calocera cornea HHB12733 TaxID=1353952 RepID=A0A165DBB7_9BASI|nr:hypothetical protein CALCODRAFT_90090 [Calocera cornea HHB12733]
MPMTLSTSKTLHTLLYCLRLSMAATTLPWIRSIRSPSSAIDEIREKIRNTYHGFLRGPIPDSYRKSEEPFRDRLRGYDSGALCREMHKLPDSYFAADGDPQHVLARLPELQRIYSDILPTYSAGLSSVGVPNAGTMRTTWDRLLNCIGVPEDNTGLHSTSHSCEENVALSAPADLQLPKAFQGSETMRMSDWSVGRSSGYFIFTKSIEYLSEHAGCEQ